MMKQKLKTESEHKAEIRSNKIGKRMINTVIWIILPVLVLIGCLLIPEIYFSKQDAKTFKTITRQNLEAVNLTISSDITLNEKLFLFSHADDYSLVDLNFDYNDEYSFEDVRNMAVSELDEMLGLLHLPFYTAGIYEALINKYLVTAHDNAQLNFVVWYIDIRYFGCPMQIVLDYETESILYFSLDLRSNMNTWHDEKGFQSLAYYDTAIVPFLDFLATDENDNTAHLDMLSESFANMISEYYGYTATLSDFLSSADNLFSYTLYGKGSTDAISYYYQIEQNNLYLTFNAYY